MRQWVAEYAVDTSSGARTRHDTLYANNADDVRRIISQKGGYVMSVREHKVQGLQRVFARSLNTQIQILRGIQFRSSNCPPSIALWRLIESETDPKKQNILAPAREALSRGLGVMDALKALNMFEPGTLAILAASERSNRLQEGIPHTIEHMLEKKRNSKKIMAMAGWLGFDLVSVTQAMFFGKDLVIGHLEKSKPKDPVELEKYMETVNNLELLWVVLVWISVLATAFFGWVMFSFWYNRGKTDWPTARIVRRIPLIGGYLRDMAFADAFYAAGLMLKAKVPIADVMKQTAESSTSPEVKIYWRTVFEDLSRGIGLGQAMARHPMSVSERSELMAVSDLRHIPTVVDSISENRAMMAKTKGNQIVMGALFGTGIYLAIAFGSSVYALSVLNMGMDSMMSDVLGSGGAF
jgi:type II secretory pathway component PulF